MDKTEIKQSVIQLPMTLNQLNIVAVNVKADEYMEKYAATFHEWVNGVVYKMSPASLSHTKITAYLFDLLRAYVLHAQSGDVISAPFVMRLDSVGSRREPDLQVILGDNIENLTDTYMDGAADICIEIVSPATQDTDYGAKFNEYEKGGVKEYWIIDPKRRTARFNRLDDEGIYRDALVIDNIYTTPLLPKFQLDVSILWQMELPSIYDAIEAVKNMLEQDK